MITPFVALLAVLPPSVEGQWGTSPLTPLALAAKADDRLATLRNAKLTYHYTYYKEAVGFAFADCEANIVAPNVFWLQVPNVNPKRNNVIEHETWIADGRRFGSAVNPDQPRPKPLALRPKGTPKPVNAWFTDFSRIILSGLGQPTHPFTGLVQDATRSGYRVGTEVRKLTLKGQRYTSYRLVLSKGKTRYETVIDGDRFLPVSVTNTVGDVDNSRWSGRLWSFPRKPISRSIATFRAPAKTTVSLRAPRPR